MLLICQILLKMILPRTTTFTTTKQPTRQRCTRYVMRSARTKFLFLLSLSDIKLALILGSEPAHASILDLTRTYLTIRFGVVMHAWRVLSWSNRTSSLSSLCIVRVEALIKPEPYIRQEKFVPVGSQNLNFDILSLKVFVTRTSSFLRDKRTISGIQ